MPRQFPASPLPEFCGSEHQQSFVCPSWPDNKRGVQNRNKNAKVQFEGNDLPVEGVYRHRLHKSFSVFFLPSVLCPVSFPRYY